MTVRRRLAAILMAAALFLAALLLIHEGVYGYALFAATPLCLGALTCWRWHPKTALRAATAGAVAVMIASSAFLLVGVEGLICVVMSWPLVVPLGALGGWLAYRASGLRTRPGHAALLLAVPLGALGWDVSALPPVFEVRTAIEIAAPPGQVWKHVVTFSELPPPQEWFFRAGVAYPKRARIQGSGPGAVRYCEFSTGPFVEPIEIWDEPKLLRFRVTSTPAPLEEWSPYPHVVPKHLHGYLISKRGQFRLTPLANGCTLLEGTTWYQHGLWPAQYWRWWSDAIIHRIHVRVLDHIRTLAENDRLP